MLKYILLITPSAIEAGSYLKYLNKPKKLNLPFKAYKGYIGEHNIIIAEIGIGKLNAGFNTAQILQKYNISQILILGIAGISPQIAQSGDICIGKCIFNSDINYLFDGSERANLNINVSNLFFESDINLINNFKEFFQSFNWRELSPEIQEYNKLYKKQALYPKLIECTCASGDSFFHGFKASQWIEKRALELTPLEYGMTEMEGLAICHIAQIHKIPALIIKIACNFDRPWAQDISGENSLKEGLKLIPQIAKRETDFIVNYLTKV